MAAKPKSVEKHLDELDLARLEDDRRVTDMEGWGDRASSKRWNPPRSGARKSG